MANNLNLCQEYNQECSFFLVTDLPKSPWILKSRRSTDEFTTYSTLERVSDKPPPLPSLFFRKLYSFFFLLDFSLISYSSSLLKKKKKKKYRETETNDRDFIFLQCSTFSDDGRVMKALNTRSPVTRNESNQVIVSDVQVLRYGTYLPPPFYSTNHLCTSFFFASQT